jgi:glycosyltransferase involved in cell wall biosynthesis
MNKLENIFPLISVIVTTKEEQQHLPDCLKSIENQTYKNIEIIVVDNYSKDTTLRIAKSYTDNVYLKGNERSQQRNYGIKKAKGKYIIYLDADMRLQPNLIEECVKQIQDVDALYISERIMGTSFLSRIRRFERSFYDATAIDCVRFMKRSAFLKAGGFNENVSGPEDWWLDKSLKRQGYKFALLKNSHINHDESNIILKDYLNKKSYYVKSFDKYVEKWGVDDEDIKKQLSPCYRFIGVFIEDGKWKKLLKYPILTIGMYYLRFRVGIRYLKRDRNGS